MILVHQCIYIKNLGFSCPAFSFYLLTYVCQGPGRFFPDGCARLTYMCHEPGPSILFVIDPNPFFEVIVLGYKKIPRKKHINMEVMQ